MTESGLERLEVGIVAFRQGYYFNLQLRNGEESSGALGLIGFFGGQLDPGETAIEAASRELAEETNARIKPSHLVQIDHLEVPCDFRGGIRLIVADVFAGDLPTTMPVYARKGELVRWTLGEVLDNMDRLTPVTRAFFERNY